MAKVSRTNRGFKVSEPIIATDGTKVKVKESCVFGNDYGPCILLKLTGDILHSDLSKVQHNKDIAARLSFDQVDELIKNLRWMKKNHYQVK